MLNALCWLYSKLQPDEVMIIRYNDDMECVVSTGCRVQKKGSAFAIEYPNGTFCVVNPAQVINARIISKEDWLQ